MMQTPLQLRLQPRPPAVVAARHRRRLQSGFPPPNPRRGGGWCRGCAYADAGKAQAQARRAYPYDEIEPRWQRHWEEHRTFRTPDIGHGLDTSKPKCYILDMFPYPRFAASLASAYYAFCAATLALQWCNRVKLDLRPCSAKLG